MIVLVLMALLLGVSARPALALGTLALGVLVKYLPLILLPAQLVYGWRTGRRQGRVVPHLLVGLLAGLGLAVLLYRPLWAGVETFRGLYTQGQPRDSASIAGMLYWALAHSPFGAGAARLTSGILAGILGVSVLLMSWRVRDAGSYLEACGGIALVYLLVASPGYWPWYATLPLALMALSPHGTFRWMALMLSCCSRLAAPLEVIANRGFITPTTSLAGTATIAIALPLLALLLLAAREWRRLNTTARAAPHPASENA